MTQYYQHMEDREGGKNAAARDFAQQNIDRIEAIKKELDVELRFWNHVLPLDEGGDSHAGPISRSTAELLGHVSNRDSSWQ